jgi:hypothetical protein
MNVRYDNNFEVDSINNYIHCNNDVLNVDITAEELFKAVKGLKNKKSLLFSKYFSNLLNKILVNNLLRQLEIAIHVPL